MVDPDHDAGQPGEAGQVLQVAAGAGSCAGHCVTVTVLRARRQPLFAASMTLAIYDVFRCEPRLVTVGPDLVEAFRVRARRSKASCRYRSSVPPFGCNPPGEYGPFHKLGQDPENSLIHPPVSGQNLSSPR